MTHYALAGAAEAIAQHLRRRGETLAVAEATAGGRIAAALTAIPGSSAWFLGSAVVYSAAAKVNWLGLTDTALSEHGAVAAETALQMAVAARTHLGATWGLGESGIAGPQTGRRSTKPPGLTFLALAGPTVATTRRLSTGRDERVPNQVAFALAALELLLAALTQES